MNREYTPDFAKNVLNECFPELIISSIIPFGEGHDCKAFLVNDTYVFKFPKSEKANNNLQKELRVLRFLKGKLPLEIPQVIFSSNKSSLLPYLIIGYKQIKGRILTPELYQSFTDMEKENLAKQIADFLRILHSLEIPCNFTDLEDNFIEGMMIDYEDIKSSVFGRINDKSKNFAITYYSNAIHNPDFKNPRTALIHNDLSCNHILIDEIENKAIGIIDFGDAAVTDIDLDFVYLFEDSEEEIGHKFGGKVLHYYKHENIPLLMKKITLIQQGEMFEKILLGKSMGLTDMYNEGLNELMEV